MTGRDAIEPGIAGQARQFASREYLHALYKGDRMTAEERTKAIADLSRLTGLSKAFLVSKGVPETSIAEEYTPFGHSDYQTIVGKVKEFG